MNTKYLPDKGVLQWLFIAANFCEENLDGYIN